MNYLYKKIVNDKIIFMDDIMVFLIEKKSKEISLDDIIFNVGYKNFKGPVFTRLPKFSLDDDALKIFFSKTLDSLISKGLVQNLNNTQNYSITFDGILMINEGGITRKKALKKITGFLGRLSLIVAFFTFVFTIIKIFKN